MNRNNFWKFVLVISVFVWSLLEMYPPTNRNLVQEFKDKAVESRKDAAFTGIVDRLDKLQSAKPEETYANLVLAIGTNDITRYFPMYEVKNELHPDRAVLNRLQQDAAGKIKLSLDLQGGTSFLVGMDTTNFTTDCGKQQALSEAVEVLRKRVDKFGVAEPVIQPAGEDRILIQLPGLSEDVKERAREQIQKVAYHWNFGWCMRTAQELPKEGLSEPGYEVLRQTQTAPDGSTTVESLLVTKKAVRGLTGNYVKNAMMERDPATGQAEISLVFDSQGAELFGQITRDNVGRRLAIVLDGELQSAPRINEPIEGGQARISGNFTDKEANDLANVLENPLQAPVEMHF